MIGIEGNDLTLEAEISPNTLLAKNGRHGGAALMVLPMADGTWAIFDQWRRYIPRVLVGLDPGVCPRGEMMELGFWPGELPAVLELLRAEYDFKSLPGGAKSPGAAGAAPFKPEDLDL